MSRKEELFGKLCRDKITGFEGVCTGRTEWIYGCDQYCLTPRVQDDKTKLNDGQWFDDGRLEVIELCLQLLAPGAGNLIFSCHQ